MTRCGPSSRNYRGDSTSINEDSITTGDGVAGQLRLHHVIYDKLFHSMGMRSVSADHVWQDRLRAQQRQDHRRRVAVGSAVAGGYSLIDAHASPPSTSTRASSPPATTRPPCSPGNQRHGRKHGPITTGDYDISAFQPNQYSADVFATAKRRGLLGHPPFRAHQLRNDHHGRRQGRCVAAYDVRFRLRSHVIQKTGRHHDGRQFDRRARHGDLVRDIDNKGGISVGDDSVGVDMTAGAAFLHTGQLTRDDDRRYAAGSNAGISKPATTRSAFA